MFWVEALLCMNDDELTNGKGSQHKPRNRYKDCLKNKT